MRFIVRTLVLFFLSLLILLLLTADTADATLQRPAGLAPSGGLVSVTRLMDRSPAALSPVIPAASRGGRNYSAGFDRRGRGLTQHLVLPAVEIGLTAAGPDFIFQPGPMGMTARTGP